MNGSTSDTSLRDSFRAAAVIVVVLLIVSGFLAAGHYERVMSRGTESVLQAIASLLAILLLLAYGRFRRLSRQSWIVTGLLAVLLLSDTLFSAARGISSNFASSALFIAGLSLGGLFAVALFLVAVLSGRRKRGLDPS